MIKRKYTRVSHSDPHHFTLMVQNRLNLGWNIVTEGQYFVYDPIDHKESYTMYWVSMLKEDEP